MIVSCDLKFRYIGSETHLGAPLQPQLEDVVVAATLDHLVSRVVLHVVQLILHEQVVRTHLVTAEQQTLPTKCKIHVIKIGKLLEGYLLRIKSRDWILISQDKFRILAWKITFIIINLINIRTLNFNYFYSFVSCEKKFSSN